MELKPQRNASWPSRQRRGAEGDKSPSPWKGLEQALGAKPSARRRWAAETRGATPPRDGPWAVQAQELGRLLPPRTRKERREP